MTRSPAARSALHRLGALAPPVLCLGSYPPEAGLAPAGSVAYLVEPSSRAEPGGALGALFA